MDDERHNISSVPFISRGPGPQQSITRSFPPSQSPANHGEASNQTPNEPVAPHFEPSVADVIILRRMFTNPAVFLPTELVDAIIDYAEYWPHSTTEADYIKERKGPLNVAGSTPTENQFLFRCPPVGWVKPVRSDELSYERHESKPLPLSAECTRDFFETQTKNVHPDLAFPVRKVVFTIKSHDQGWASGPGLEGGYDGSWTWFEAGLERFDQQECSRDCAYDVSAPRDGHEPPALPVRALRPLYPPVVAAAADDSSSNPAYKLEHDLFPDGSHTVQVNKKATSGTTEHRVVWSYLDGPKKDDNGSEPMERVTDEGRISSTSRGEFVRKLKLGDVITLWAKARFPGWRNCIEAARVDIYWSI